MSRLQATAKTLSGQPALSGGQSDDDVVIIEYHARAAHTASFLRKGGMRDLLPEDMLSAVLKAVVERAKVKPELVQDIVVGNVCQAGAGALTARMAAFHAGFPDGVSVAAVNRQCSSGLQAVASVAAAIRAGYIEIGIGAGVESMTHNYGPQSMPSNISQDVLSSKEAQDCMLPMGATSENVAARFNVTRAEQDAFAMASHQKAFKARSEGKFREEIVAVKGVSEDDGIRGDVRLEQLSMLKPSFKEDGCTTAGNASQVSDGAAAVLLMRRSRAKAMGVRILGRFVGFATAGCPPGIMGIGPVLAIPAVMRQTGISPADVAVVELNEAFASQALYCIQKLRLPMDRVNPSGGAIALGHPLGATGARQIATLLPELRRRRARFGIVSMCMGTGMGAAAVVENEQL